MAKTEILLFWKDDCPDSARALEEVSAVARTLDIAMRPLFARETAVGPLITRYEVCELPTVVVLQSRRVVWLGTGKAIRSPALRSRLELLQDATASRKIKR